MVARPSVNVGEGNVLSVSVNSITVSTRQPLRTPPTEDLSQFYTQAVRPRKNSHHGCMCVCVCLLVYGGTVTGLNGGV